MGKAWKGIVLWGGVLLLSVSLTASLATPARAGKKVDKPAADGKPPKGFNARTTEKHLRDHQRYPATRAEILAECDNLSDFTDQDRRWFAEKLPEATYHSPDEVLEVIGLRARPTR